MKHLKKIMLGFLLGFVFCVQAHAAGSEVNIDNKNLVDLLLQKGVISKDEAKFVEKTNYDRLTLSATGFISAMSDTVNQTSAAGKTTAMTEQTGLFVDRFYLQAIYHINDTWYGRITTDVQNEQTATSSSAAPLKRNMNVFLKYAYLEGNFIPELQVRFGLSHTPWIDYEEGLWKHRYVSKVFTDFYAFDDSSDYGVGIKGKIQDGLLEYWLTETNGGGYSKPNATKGMDFNSRLTLRPVKGVDLSVQFRDGDRGTNILNSGTSTTPTHSSLYQGLLSYSMENFRLGGNYVQNEQKVSGAAYSTKDEGYALWGWYNFIQDYGAFGRYESLDTKNAVSAPITQKTNHYVVGVEYLANKNLSFSLAYDYTQKENFKNVNGDKQEDAKYGLYAQFTF